MELPLMSPLKMPKAYHSAGLAALGLQVCIPCGSLTERILRWLGGRGTLACVLELYRYGGFVCARRGTDL